MKTTPTTENADLEAALDRLAESPQAITHTARVRRMLPKIEAALSAGSSLSEVHQTLVDTGWSISEGAFRGALNRARKTPGKGGQQQAKRPALAPAPVQAPALDTAPTAPPDAARRSKKQQRELAADQWITDPPNAIIDRFIDKERKS